MKYFKLANIEVEIDRKKPDLVIIGGDLANSASENHYQLDYLLKMLSQIAPTIITLGNKDQMDEVDNNNVLDIKWEKKINDEWFNHIKNQDCTLLSDAFSKLDLTILQ